MVPNVCPCEKSCPRQIQFPEACLLEALLEQIPAVVMQVAPDQVLIVRGPSGLLLGSPQESWLRAGSDWQPTLENHVDDRDREGLRGFFVGLFEDRNPDDLVCRFRNAGGEIRSLRVSGRVLPAPQGGDRHQAAFLDETARAGVELELRDINHRFEAVVQSVSDVIFTLDAQGRIMFITPSIEKLTGFGPVEVLGYPITEVLTRESNVHLIQALSPFLRRNPDAAPPDRSGRIEMETLRSDGTVVLLEVLFDVLRVADLGEARVLGVARDITAKKAAEKAVRDSRDKLQALAGHLTTIREEERRSMAREIHDEVGQLLAVIKIELGLLQSTLDRSGLQDPSLEATYAQIGSLQDLLASGIDSVRRLLNRLRPSMLDDLGLMPTIEWHLQDTQKRSGLTCSLKNLVGEIDLPKGMAVALYRIFQEAVTNVLRHAQARHLQVCVDRAGADLHLVISDDGTGLIDKEGRSRRTFGIMGMEERAEMLGGTLRIHSDGVTGTTVEVIAPLPKHDER